MLVMTQTFTRQSTSVPFYSITSSPDGAKVINEIILAKDNGSIVSVTDTTSVDDLVFTRVVNFKDQAAFDAINANPVLAANKQRREAYNTVNNIIETQTLQIV